VIASSAWAAITKYHRPGDIKNTYLFLTTQTMKVQNQGAGRLCLGRTLFLVCTHLSFHYVLNMAESGQRKKVLISLLIRVLISLMT
jgi:hypothetical protein